jgi:hypothetical protein
MLDVLFLLAVSRRFLQSFDDQGGSRRDNGNGSLSILDGELYCDTKAFL